MKNFEKYFFSISKSLQNSITSFWVKFYTYVFLNFRKKFLKLKVFFCKKFANKSKANIWNTRELLLLAKLFNGGRQEFFDEFILFRTYRRESSRWRVQLTCRIWKPRPHPSRAPCPSRIPRNSIPKSRFSCYRCTPNCFVNAWKRKKRKFRHYTGH